MWCRRSIWRVGDLFYSANHVGHVTAGTMSHGSTRIVAGDSNAPMLAVNLTAGGWYHHAGFADPNRHGGRVSQVHPFATRRGNSGANYLFVDGHVAFIAGSRTGYHGISDPRRSY